jgi:hypothetical protein
MRPICALLGALAFLSVAMSAAQAELRDRAGALDWQTFMFPNMELAWNTQQGSSPR